VNPNDAARRQTRLLRTSGLIIAVPESLSPRVVLRERFRGEPRSAGS
jgi:hypothetical protein